MAAVDPTNMPSGFRLLPRRCGDLWDLSLFRECSCGCLACPEGLAGELGPQGSLAEYARSKGGGVTLAGLGLRSSLPEEIRRWVRARDLHRPDLVTVGLRTEPLPGFGEAEEVLGRCLRILLEAGMNVTFQTRRVIPESILEILSGHGARARVLLPIPTLSDAELRLWEPGTAMANQRLWNLQQLRRRGVPVLPSISPLIPYVNDDHPHLAPLVRALGDSGARSITAEFLRLGRRVRSRLERRSPVSTRLIFGAYADRPLDARQDTSRPLLERRRRVYRAIARLAATRRLRFSVCRCSDPELGSGRCRLWLAESSSTPHSPSGPSRGLHALGSSTRAERARVRSRPLKSSSQATLSDLWDSKQ